MKAQHSRSVALAALSSVLLALLSGNVVAATSSDAPSECVPAFIGDGDCDFPNNNENCGYDGGDCCECTCVDTENYVCGSFGGFGCLDPRASCVDDDDVTFLPAYDDEYTDPESSTSLSCYEYLISDGDCDLRNNREDCGYDGGDCCECTCVSTDAFTCGDTTRGGFSCLDPSAPCVDDDDVTTLPESESSYSEPEPTMSPSCASEVIADGNCDSDYNNEECGYDGGDCCECTCVSTAAFTCSDNGDFDCVDPSSPCIDGYVQAGTKTIIDVFANAYDTRPGQDSGDVGCGQDGCEPKLSRDGISADTESRWSCAQKIVPDGGLCAIEFVFENPQDIVEVEVAFWKGDVRSRTLEAAINGEVIGEFESYPGPTFNALGIEGDGVNTLTLTSVNLAEDEWISLLEVRFLVEP